VEFGVSLTRKQRLYYFLRASSALLGLFLIASAIFSLLYPDIVHEETQRLGWQNRLLDVAFLFYGLSLLAPYRWLKRRFLFSVALLVFAIGGMWMVYVSFTGLVGLIQGRKSWHILPASVIVVALAWSAPAALVMRRRLDADTNN
jgi:hypothetical protein